MFLKPATPGLIVRDPISLLLLPDEGAEKPESSYWVRRLADGDVVEAAAPDAERVEAESTPATSRRRTAAPATE